MAAPPPALAPSPAPSLVDPVLALILQLLRDGTPPKKVLEALDLPPAAHPLTTPQAVLAHYRSNHGLTRRKLPGVNSLDDALALLRAARRVLVLVGAGISVSSGVPDFRSAGAGLYDALRRSSHPALAAVSDPQELFDYETFTQEPEIFFSLARLLYPDDDDDASGGGGSGGSDVGGASSSSSSSTSSSSWAASTAGGDAPASTSPASSSSSSAAAAPAASPTATTFTPSLTHRFLAALAAGGRLQRLYTQNVDGLEAAAGVPPAQLVQCHGSLATVTCLRCRRRRPASDPLFLAAVRGGTVARCDGAGCAGKPDALLKPDCVFFREPLPASFEGAIAGDMRAADLLLVIGSSLQVKPVSAIPGALPRGTPAVLINATPLFPHAFDVDLLGPADVVCEHLWRALDLPGLPAALEAAGLGQAATATGAAAADGGSSAAAAADAPATVTAAAAATTEMPAGAGGAASSAAAASVSSSSAAGVAAAVPPSVTAGGDITITHEPPSRYRFASPRHAAVADATRQCMLARLDRVLGQSAAAAAAAAAGGGAAGPSNSRSGRQIKRPRR
jgi:NAD-dependent SIR2 family protein deacetylase